MKANTPVGCPQCGGQMDLWQEGRRLAMTGLFASVTDWVEVDIYSCPAVIIDHLPVCVHTDDLCKLLLLWWQVLQIKEIKHGQHIHLHHLVFYERHCLHIF